MIPLRDENPNRRFPVVTIVLIVVNLCIFVYQIASGPKAFEVYVQQYGLVPSEFFDLQRGHFVVLRSIATVFSSMFMHGGWAHVIGNMWFLWIFGDNIEGILGHTRYLVFYLFAGIVAVLAHAMMNSHETLPLVGASGAISGVLGAYFLKFPFNRILTLVPIVFFVTTVQIPAVIFLGFWFLIQLLYSSLGGHVAWWAHIGGFVAGVLLVGVFQKPRRK